MGTSDSYEGSGGAWNGAQRDLGDLLSGGETTPADVCGDAAGALDWGGNADGADNADIGNAGDGNESPQIPFAGTEIAPIRIGTRGGGGGGGGARPGGGRRTATSGTGGGGRSRRRAASTGARVAAAGYALRAGDAAALLRLGLDLAQLAGLSPTQQAQRIIDVIVGATTSIEDAEVARASASMIIELLERVAEPTPEEVVRIFAIEYVYEIFLTELGLEMRDGTRDGAASVVTEDDIHDLIEARVASLAIEGDSVDAGALEAALDDVLEFTRRIIYERPGE